MNLNQLKNKLEEILAVIEIEKIRMDIKYTEPFYKDFIIEDEIKKEEGKIDKLYKKADKLLLDIIKLTY